MLVGVPALSSPLLLVVVLVVVVVEGTGISVPAKAKISHEVVSTALGAAAWLSGRVRGNLTECSFDSGRRSWEISDGWSCWWWPAIPKRVCVDEVVRGSRCSQKPSTGGVLQFNREP